MENFAIGDAYLEAESVFTFIIFSKNLAHGQSLHCNVTTGKFLLLEVESDMTLFLAETSNQLA